MKDGNTFLSMYESAQTRQKSDWLVGINLSRLYTLYMQKYHMQGAFSIGRVQTPTLFLVFKRNNEIENFVSKPFYELKGQFQHTNGVYEGKYNEKFTSRDQLQAFLTEYQLNGGTAVVSNIQTKEKTTYSPKLFNLSDLQTRANKLYNYSASKTLEVAQKLYEKQFLSYPRSDSNYIGTPEFSYLKQQLPQYLSLAEETIEQHVLKENKRYVANEKVKEHYAIIPTKTVPETLNHLSYEERHIYLLVIKRVLAMFEQPYRYEETVLVTTINNVDFESKDKVEIQRGWKRLLKKEINTSEQPFPKIYQGDQVDYQIKMTEGHTTPPSYFTEGTLLTAMKNVGNNLDDENKEILKSVSGIGTQATRASIIDVLKVQDYLEVKKSKLYLSDKGKILCQVLKDTAIVNAEMTGKWEKYLSQIEEGKGNQETFIQSIQRFIKYEVDHAEELFDKHKDTIVSASHHMIKEKIVGSCPKCLGQVIDRDTFYGCTGYPDCRFSLPYQLCKKTLPIKAIKTLISGGVTDQITGMKSKKGTSFSCRLKLVDGRIDMVFDKIS